MNFIFVIVLIIIFILILVTNYSFSIYINYRCNKSIPQNNTNQNNNIIQNNHTVCHQKNNKVHYPELNKIKIYSEEENYNDCSDEINSKINPEILSHLEMKTLENFGLNSMNMIEPFKLDPKAKISNQISFKKINSNNLYYGLPCNYIKDDCFYDAIKKAGFNLTDNIKVASLIVPCSYETTEKEIGDLEQNGIKLNQYSDAVRIFMLNNTDYMVSKLALWKYLKNKYGQVIAANMLPYTWDLTDDNEVELFKKQFNPNKIYITKNNYQRQEGLEIHTKLETILNSRDKYILVQELLQDPYLVSKRKINLRVYVLVIKDNYSNIKLQVYRDGFMYYTPEFFEPNTDSFQKNITTGYIDRQVYVENPLTHMDFRVWLDNPNRQLTDIESYIKSSHPNIKLSDFIFSQIYEQLGFVFQTYETIVGTKSLGVSFQLYGVDVAINQDLKPMLMEINKGPDLTAKDGRDKDLKVNLCTDILKSVGLIDNINNNFITVLETVNINGNIVSIQNLIDH